MYKIILLNVTVCCQKGPKQHGKHQQSDSRTQIHMKCLSYTVTTHSVDCFTHTLVSTHGLTKQEQSSGM